MTIVEFDDINVNGDFEYIQKMQIQMENIFKEAKSKFRNLSYITLNSCVNHIEKYKNNDRVIIQFLDFYDNNSNHLYTAVLTNSYIHESSILKDYVSLLFIKNRYSNKVRMIHEKFTILKYHSLEKTHIKETIINSSWFKYNLIVNNKKQYSKYVFPVFNQKYRNLMFNVGWSINNFRGSVIPVIDTPEQLLLNVYLYDNYLCKGVYTMNFDMGIIDKKF